MYGTIARWVQKLSEWNPTLTEEDCFAVVTSLFGIELPGVHSLMDMELGFPEAFSQRLCGVKPDGHWRLLGTMIK